MNHEEQFEPNTLSQLKYKGVIYNLRDKSKIPLTEKGAPNGVATLDEQGSIPQSQMYNSIRYGKTADWNSDLSFIPKKGQIIVYSDHGQMQSGDKMVDVPGFKVGDGLAYLVDLPFVGDDNVKTIMGLLRVHTDNTDIHVTLAEKEFWNNKLNYTLADENLVLNRL